MSSQKGNVKKSGPPKYQNKRAFKNNLHDKTKKIQMINSLQLGGLCESCKGVIEWKIKYKKYKPLTVPKTCVKCSQKTVKRAYYTVCQACSESLKLCGKCGKAKEIVEKMGLTPEEEARNQAQLDQELKHLPERKRRAFLRNVAAGNCAGCEEGAGATCGDLDSEDSDDHDTDSEGEASHEEDSQDERIAERLQNKNKEQMIAAENDKHEEDSDKELEGKSEEEVRLQDVIEAKNTEQEEHEHSTEDKAFKALSLNETN